MSAALRSHYNILYLWLVLTGISGYNLIGIPVILIYIFTILIRNKSETKKVHKKLCSNNRHQGNSFYDKETSSKAIEDSLPLSPQKNLTIPHTIDTSQILKNLHYVEKNKFQYASDIVTRIVADATGTAWLDYFDLLKSRFDWVYTHSINVAVISVMMAAELGYHKMDLECIALGGLLHDVGKLLIPTSIIQKDSSLDDMQMELMRKHSELGMSLVAICGLSDDCNAMILQHHERLDGCGYPYGLKSDNIHAYAKIAMLADVLDAITSHRPYRPGKSVSVAIQIIKDEGPKFAAECVSVIEKLLCERPT